MQDFVAIPLTEEMVRLAEEGIGRAWERRERPSGRTYTRREYSPHVIGDIGEMAFEEFLKRNEVPYSKDKIYLDQGDKFDFIVHGDRIDVKTGHLSWEIERLQPGYRFFISKYQLGQEMGFYVNIQLDPPVDTAYITGFISSDKAKSYPIENTEAMVGPAAAIPLSDLTDIRQLIDGEETENQTKQRTPAEPGEHTSIGGKIWK